MHREIASAIVISLATVMVIELLTESAFLAAAVTVTVPSLTPVTNPLVTVAILSSLVVQTTSCEAVAGLTVAVICNVPPSLTAVMLFAVDSATDVGVVESVEESLSLITNAKVALIFSSATLVAVIVTLPAAIAVTKPLESTVAFDVSADCQFTS